MLFNGNSNGPSFTGKVFASIMKGSGCLSVIISFIGIFMVVVVVIHKAFLGISRFL